MVIFGGATKVGGSITTKLERRLIDAMVPRLPLWLHSYQLTLATLPISALILVFSYLARTDIRWLWVVSALIFSQWVTDSLDGSLGKHRGEGLIRWGYYMDHFLDYVFLIAILIGYVFLFPGENMYFQFFTLAILASFMVNSFLAFGATNEFRISHVGIGPTEIRFFFILINTALVFFRPGYFAGVLPYILVLSLLVLVVVVYQTQKTIWALDMKHKKEGNFKA